MKQEPEPPDDRTRSIREKAERMAKARRTQTSLWQNLVAGGTLGWAFILPTLGGVVIGRIVARFTHTPAATIAGLLVGMLAGGFAVYWNVRRGLGDDEKKESP